MENFVKRLIKEHKDLYVRLCKLEDFIYNKDTSHIHKSEFANLCMQLAAMRQYEKCLRARLANNNIVFEDDVYSEVIDSVINDFGSEPEASQEQQEDNGE